VTGRSETSKPSFRSSPWIFGAPQPAFSPAMRRIRIRISSRTLGRRGACRERRAQRGQTRPDASAPPSPASRSPAHPTIGAKAAAGWSRKSDPGGGARVAALAFEDRHLLPESEDLQGCVHATAEEDAEGGQESEHHIKINTNEPAATSPTASDRKLLIQNRFKLLTTHLLKAEPQTKSEISWIDEPS
jgi:hypothetical protein